MGWTTPGQPWVSACLAKLLPRRLRPCCMLCLLPCASHTISATACPLYPQMRIFQYPEFLPA